MSAIEKGSVVWMGYKAFYTTYGISDEQSDEWLAAPDRDPNFAPAWLAAAKVIAEEAIRRCRASQNQADVVTSAPKSIDFLKLNAQSSGR